MLFAALALAAAPYNPAGSCALAHLDRCQSTNQLVFAKGWKREVRAFLGRAGARRTSFLTSGGTTLEAVNEVLNGPPDTPVRAGGVIRFSACRAHSCPEKGAALVTPDGRIVALAVVHSDCAIKPVPALCFVHDRLAIFVRDPATDGALIANLTEWAKDAIAADNRNYPMPSQPATTLDEVTVIRAGG